MTPSEKAEALSRLLSHQYALRKVVEAAKSQAELATQQGALGFALSIHMLCESLLVYSEQLGAFVEGYLGED
jgi:hypothetical protein